MNKRIFSFFMIFLLLFIIIPRVNALSVSESDLTLEKGGSSNISLYANSESTINSVSFTMIFSTYDIPASFTPSENCTDGNPNGITHTLTLTEPQSGKVLLGTININVKNYPNDTNGTISLHTASASTTDGETIYLNNQTINVKIGTPEKKVIDKNLLDKIESSIVKIDLKKDVFEYTVTIDKDTKELDLKPIAKDENTEIVIDTQKVEELTDNKLIIKTKLDDTEQIYTININLKDKNIDKVVIDKGEFKENKSYKGKWAGIMVFLVAAFIASLFINKKR